MHRSPHEAVCGATYREMPVREAHPLHRAPELVHKGGRVDEDVMSRTQRVLRLSRRKTALSPEPGDGQLP